MELNKKGIMVKSLVTIILAIIIFVPLILGITKYCQYSAQAGNNFVEFAGAIEKAGKEGKDDNLILIMDEETAIVGFNKGSSKVEGCEKKTDTSKEFCGHLLKPETEECREKSCICLIKSIVGWKEPGQADIRYESFSCKTVEGTAFGMQKEKQTLSAGWGEKKSDFEVTGGFFLGRSIASSEVGGVIERFPHSFNLELRRNLVHLVNRENKVFICLNPGCDDINLLVKVEGSKPTYETITS